MIRKLAAVLCVYALLSSGQSLADGFPKLETTVGDGSTLRLYGQIDQALLIHDDGGETNGYALVDNSNSATRLGLLTTSPLAEDLTFSMSLEAQYAPNPSSEVSQRNSFIGDWDIVRTDLRKAEAIISFDGVGTFWLGQGSMASDGIAEIDLSSTAVAAYSAIPDLAGGQFFREKDGTLSNVTIDDVFSNYDGSRRLRVRYDTPTLAGFTASGAYGQEVLEKGDDRDYFDAALRWGKTLESTKVSAGAGYNWKESDSQSIAGSVSALHLPTGINATLALGAETERGDGRYVYAKLGVIRDVLPIGSTAVSVDAYRGNEVNRDGGPSAAYALAAVQRIEAVNVEAYGVVRLHDFVDDTATYETGLSVMTGVRFSF